MTKRWSGTKSDLTKTKWQASKDARQRKRKIVRTEKTQWEWTTLGYVSGEGLVYNHPSHRGK